MKKENIIEIQKDVGISQGDKKIILEKGDKIKILKEKSIPENVTLFYYKGDKNNNAIFDFPAIRVSNQTLKISDLDLRSTRSPNIGIGDISYISDGKSDYVYVEYPPSVEKGYYYFEIY